MQILLAKTATEGCWMWKRSWKLSPTTFFLSFKSITEKKFIACKFLEDELLKATIVQQWFPEGGRRFQSSAAWLFQNTKLNLRMYAVCRNTFPKEVVYMHHQAIGRNYFYPPCIFVSWKKTRTRDTTLCTHGTLLDYRLIMSRPVVNCGADGQWRLRGICSEKPTEKYLNFCELHPDL